MDIGFSAKPTVNNIGIGKGKKQKSSSATKQTSRAYQKHNNDKLMVHWILAQVQLTACLHLLLDRLSARSWQTISRKQPPKSLTMSKRSAQATVAKFNGQMEKVALSDCIKRVRKQCARDPSRSLVANALMGGLERPGETETVDIKEYWWKSYGTIGKFPRQSMLPLLQENEPRLDRDKIQALKIGDRQAVDHLFQFDYGLHFKYTWPQGACHKRDVFENVLSQWRDHIGGSRIKRFLDEIFISKVIDVDWNSLGVYALVHPDNPGLVSGKTYFTYVKHKPTGSLIPIPESMNVDNTWKFTENWSDADATLVDKYGWGQKVSAFAGSDCKLPTMEEWIDFASRKAAAMVESTTTSTPCIGNNAFSEAVAIMTHQLPSAPSVPDPPSGAASAADEPLEEP